MVSRPRYVASDHTMRFLQSPFSRLVTQPWADELILQGLQKFFFPLSRLWAAAHIAEGSVERFIHEAPIQPPASKVAKIRHILDVYEHVRLKNEMTEQLWQTYFFGPEEVSEQRLQIIEEMRLDTRTAYLMTRKRFMPLRKYVKAAIALEPPTPEAIEQHYGQPGQLEQCFALPETRATVERSRSINVPEGKNYWLRFYSEDMQDMAYARVHEPYGVENPPTLIFGHGIFIEFDHHHNLINEVAALNRMGIRVIRPEAPWHGRRVLPGRFGGERLLSTSPAGLIEFLSSQTKEWANWIAWSRATSTGKVAIGGSSLGAQTAKSVAVRAKHWPKALQPDALYMVTHCAHIAEAALDGALSKIWGLSDALREKGWNKELARSWLEKLDPYGEPVMPPSHIVSVLGSEDKVTPFASGNQHLDRWQVPMANRFVYPRGHFTVPLGLIRDHEPLLQLWGLLNSPDR